MKTKTIIAVAAASAALTWQVGAQIYDTNNAVAQVFAGSGIAGNLNGQGTLAMFSDPSKIVANSSSNLFVWDGNNRLVRKITPTGAVTTFAGGGAGGLPGVGTSVNLGSRIAGAMTIDQENTIWITTSDPDGILMIQADGYIQHLSYPGLNSASGICVDSAGDIYFTGFQKVWRLSYFGVLTLFAGFGSPGGVDANGIYASFNGPSTLAADAAANIYVWDGGNRKIRRIDQSQNVTTIAGNGFGSDADGVGLNAQFNWISAMCVDNSANIYMACGSSIRKMSASTNIVTVVGSFTQSSYANGAGGLARFNGANGICLSQGMMFVADSSNQRIRQISFDPQPQLVADSNLGIHNYAGITITGLVGRTYQIQSSPNMSNWTARATLLLEMDPKIKTSG